MELLFFIRKCIRFTIWIIGLRCFAFFHILYIYIYKIYGLYFNAKNYIENFIHAHTHTIHTQIALESKCKLAKVKDPLVAIYFIYNYAYSRLAGIRYFLLGIHMTCDVSQSIHTLFRIYFHIVEDKHLTLDFIRNNI